MLSQIKRDWREFSLSQKIGHCGGAVAFVVFLGLAALALSVSPEVFS